MEIVSLEERHVPELLAFLEKHFPESTLKGDPRFFRWRFFEHPLGPAADDYLLAIHEGRIVGQWAALPDRLLCQGDWVPVVWMIDLFVEPQARRLPVAAQLFRSAMRRAHATGRPLLATGAHEGVTPFYRALKWRVLSVVDPFYSIFRPSRLLRLAASATTSEADAPSNADAASPLPSGPAMAAALWLADHVIPTGQRIDAGLAAARRGDVRVESLPRLATDEIATFVREHIGRVGCTGNRDPRVLAWKFDERPFGTHFACVARRRGAVAGYMVTRLKQRGSVRWADVADFLTSLEDPAVFDALIDATRSESLKRGADFVRLRCSRSEHTWRLRAPRWVRRSRPALDDVCLYGPEAIVERLSAGPWHHTGLASDSVDAGGDEINTA